MTAESTVDLKETHGNVETSAISAEVYCQVHLKSEGDKLLLILPQTDPKSTVKDWQEIVQDLKYCLTHHQGTWTAGTTVYLLAQNCLLDSRQLHSIGEIIDTFDLKLTCIRTSRRQTAVAAATAGYSVEQEVAKAPLFSEPQPTQTLLAEPLYLKTTLRSGMAIRHPGPVIIQGDINPGGEVIADGDIIIWGCLRGIAHAGAKGNRECCIMALRMQPTQLRIADMVARAPSVAPEVIEPEIAYITSEGIRLKSAFNFNKTHVFQPKQKGWQEKT
ncbi:septum site-determining protein MinC [Rippkaea orientalis PCC 8801]|uniref:Probable septum site-determining protein MinC n=1 Tax=Rippkaea orientalis (strain PCC 8801 / RF-1) TaxID=41431 RepID=B7JZA8_RIPO1|nr:septum site-determining protein MinC [Rippkaea orientalis]ACK67319.1 septum site-determining protein MinC [Rippkaea orientalis PCC 8801]